MATVRRHFSSSSALARARNNRAGAFTDGRRAEGGGSIGCNAWLPPDERRPSAGLEPTEISAGAKGRAARVDSAAAAWERGAPRQLSTCRADSVAPRRHLSVPRTARSSPRCKFPMPRRACSGAALHRVQSADGPSPGRGPQSATRAQVSWRRAVRDGRRALCRGPRALQRGNRRSELTCPRWPSARRDAQPPCRSRGPGSRALPTAIRSPTRPGRARELPRRGRPSPRRRGCQPRHDRGRNPCQQLPVPAILRHD
jgi:hypothetical protein